MNPPTELTEFVPEDIEPGMFRTWELKTSEFDDNVEIRNTVFSRPMKTAIALMVAWMFFIGGIIITAIIMTDHPFLPGVFEQSETHKMVAKAFVIAFATLAGLAGTGIFIAVLIYMASSNASLWKEKFRLRYNKSNGELFFPRENARYAKGDYDQLIFGMTDGYNTVKMLEEMEQEYRERHAQKGQKVGRITQSYFLVRRTNGTWVRHLLTYDQYSKSLHRAATQIQKVIQCRSVRRNMSMQECYILQYKPDDPSLDPRPAKHHRTTFYIYCGCTFFMIQGLACLGYGLWQMDTNAIIHGAASSVFTVFFVSLWRWFECRNNPAAPYTPSEPVFEENC